MFEHLGKYEGEINVGDVFTRTEKTGGFTTTVEVIGKSMSTKDKWEVRINNIVNVPRWAEKIKRTIGTKTWAGRNDLFNWEKVEAKRNKVIIEQEIELALATRDEEWFYSLTDELKNLQEEESKCNSKISI